MEEGVQAGIKIEGGLYPAADFYDRDSTEQAQSGAMCDRGQVQSGRQQRHQVPGSIGVTVARITHDFAPD
jgi:hypothetical protein